MREGHSYNHENQHEVLDKRKPLILVTVFTTVGNLGLE